MTAVAVMVAACSATTPSPDTTDLTAPSSPGPESVAPVQGKSRVERVDYTTQYEGAEIGKHALVYLPAGYDETARYDVLYYMHGAGMTADSLLEGAGASTVMSEMLDEMIASGEVDPMIVVTPSFYPDDNASLDLHYAGELDRAFHTELERDLMPAVESRYRTYAETAEPPPPPPQSGRPLRSLALASGTA